jgi:outer membrane protein TolC
MPGDGPRPGRLGLPHLAALLAVFCAGCGSEPVMAPSAAPHQPWNPPTSLRGQVTTTLAQYGQPPPAGSLPVDPGEQASSPATSQIVDATAPVGSGGSDASTPLDTAHPYALWELIDLAQRRNPATRVAWEEARQAALATGVARATLLPRLAASVVGGYQRLSTPVTLPLVGTQTLTTDVQGVMPILTVEWLLFDFGEREAMIEASRHLTTIANVKFNQIHQQLVFDVTRAFNALAAAERKETASGRALAAARLILAAAETREQRGVGTRIEISQARQQLAQTELSLVQAQGEATIAQVALNTALGKPPGTRLHILDDRESLPRMASANLDQVIAATLAGRPDIITSVARLKAAEAEAGAVNAGFMPKVGLIAGLSTIDNQFSINSGSALGTPLDQTGILLGMTLPLYDGGLRDSRAGGARSRVMAAQAAVALAHDAAALEIATAYEVLRTSLAACQAAEALVAAAKVTADAGRKGLEAGLGTLTDAIAAEKGLLDAEMVLAEARRTAFDAAASLAFVTAALPAGGGMGVADCGNSGCS